MKFRIEELLDWSEPKRVRTKNGPRDLHKGKPTAKFWEAWRAAKTSLKDAGVSLNKDNGDWEAMWWRPIDEAEQVEKIEKRKASRATSADIDLPKPEGLEYLPFQKAGIAYALDKFGFDFSKTHWYDGSSEKALTTEGDYATRGLSKNETIEETKGIDGSQSGQGTPPESQKESKSNAEGNNQLTGVEEKSQQGDQNSDAQTRNSKETSGRTNSSMNFKGGNGQQPIPIILQLAERLEPLGFIRELPIKTKGHGTRLKVPTCYKVDFGHPKKKVAIEVDGPSHRARARQKQDRKKEIVLKALGWKVKRIKH
jgi:hypothetical protein